MKVTVKKKDSRVPVVIHTEFIRLQDAMKYANAAESGGMAKTAIQEGDVLVTVGQSYLADGSAVRVVSGED